MEFVLHGKLCVNEATEVFEGVPGAECRVEYGEVFFGWVEGYLVVVAPLVDEVLAVFELLVDVVVGRMAWKLFVGGEVVGEE